MNATCRTDADCGETRCATSTVPGVCAFDSVRFDCQNPTDECAVDADCDGTAGRAYCIKSVEGRRCRASAVCGRPFLVDGGSRSADLVLGAVTDWTAPALPDVSRLEPGQRLELAEHWSRMALMEHASVAAFARFVLELLSLGAPAELVREAERAMRDEIEHAELCFGLASAYAGQPLGPGPLTMDGALTGRSRREIVLCAFREACLGETEAAVEARAALEGARDPAVRSVLSRIAVDEARHAELGYRFLKFALGAMTERQGLSVELRDELLAARKQPRTHNVPCTELAEHGLISATASAQARAEAIAEIVVPCTLALLGEGRDVVAVA